MYKLSDAVAHLNGIPWVSRSVDGEQVEGFFDGRTVYFRVSSPPIVDAAGLEIIDPTGAVQYTVVTCNADTGAFTLDIAPVEPILASYVAGLLPTTKLQWLCREGLREMESRWRRGYSYVSNGSNGEVISSSPSTAVDPVVSGSRTFSQSQAQISFYQACCEYVFLKAMAQEAANNSVSYREERVGGLAIDATRRSRDWAALLTQAATDLVDKESQARSEAGDVEEFGYFMPGPRLVSGRWIDYGESE